MTIQEAVPPARHPRLDALDAFRGLAAFWVVLHHVILRYPYFLLGQPMPETPVFLGFSLADAGTVPVLWFFLISGFVITWTIDRTRTPMDFVVSRFSRLYPAYWASIAVTVGLAALAPLPGIGFTPRQVLVNLTMLQDFVGVVSVDGAFWSLAVELVFYVLALSVFRLGLWRFVHVLALAWAMLGLMAAVLGRWDIHAPWRVNQFLLLDYMPLLAAGMMLYRLWRRQHQAWSAATLGICVAAILAGNPPVTAALCFVAIGLIAWAAHGGMRWLAAAPLLWLGAISYSLYLSHEMVSFTVIHALDAAGLPHAASIIASIVVALLLASAISYGIERPALRRIRAAWRARGIRQALAAAATGGPAARPATPGSPG
jgi:peptidoglycan/LPS O-acetylase OafA/YrhL